MTYHPTKIINFAVLAKIKQRLQYIVPRALAMKDSMQTNLRQAIIISIMALSLIIMPKAYPQKAPVNESQLKKQANNYFEDEDYANAYLQYSQLLSLYPQDPNYNYRFGACMLFSQADKKKPIDYIETAVKQSTVENLAYFYLGRAYHLNYRFDDAIRAYQHFKQNASGSDLKKHPVDRLIEMCNNGKQLLGNLHDLDVLRKKELGSADYYQAYDLSENGGTLLTEPDDFKTKTDKKKNLTSIIYLSPDRKKLFFASYGDDDKNGKDIYIAYRLPNGAWGKPTNLGTVINTPYDEDYPFYDAPTQTLYFCSMGHNSMGGYDIFKSTYNEANNSWSQPVNMDFPINTPGDDILFIADTMNETAFFSSTRSSPNGRIAVYKINIQPHPPEYVVVKGTSYNDAGSATTSSRITVKDYQTNETVGVFNSSADNGSYVLNLVNGGHFNFTVETGNHKTQSESVTLPMQNGLNPIQQQISYEASTDRLIIRNITNGTVSDSNYLLALDMIQKRADMDVNVDTTAPRKPIVTQTNNPLALNNSGTVQPSDTSGADTTSDIAIDSTGKNGVNNNQLIQIAQNDAKQQQDDANSQKDDANRAIQYAANKLIESQNISRHAGEVAARADMLTDQQQRNDTLKLALQLKQQAQDVQKKADEAFQYASQLEIQAIVKQKEADQANQYTTSLDSALKSPNKEKSIKKLQAQRDSLQKQDILNAPTSPTAADLVRLQAQNAKQDSIEVVKHNEDLQKEADRLQKESDDYVSEAQKTKDPNEKVALLEQARDLTNSKKEKENEIQDNQKTLIDLHNQYNDMQTQSKQLDSIAKNNPSSLQINQTDVSTLKSDIKNYTPTAQTNGVHADSTHRADTNHNENVVVGQPGVPLSSIKVPENAFTYLGQPTDTNSKRGALQNPVQTSRNHTTADTTQRTQPIVINNPTQNPVQTNPIHTSTDTTQHIQPIVSNSPTQNPVQSNPVHTPADTIQHTQPIVSNNPTQNPAQANPVQTITDTVQHTQPIVSNNSTQNLTQTNPVQTTTDTVQHTQPIVSNNFTQNPVQTNPVNTATDATQHTQPIVSNNSIQNPIQTNPVNTTADTTQHAQSIVSNNPTQNPAQTNPVHSNIDTAQHTQPIVNNNSVQNPVQTNPIQATTDTAQHNQSNNPVNATQNISVNNTQPPAITYSSPTAAQSSTNAANFTKESAQLSTQAEDTRNQARQSTDPQQAKILFRRADSLDDAASEGKIVASIYKNDADGSQYLTNQQQLSAWQTAMKSSTSDKVASAELLSVDANGYYNQSVREKQKADSTTVPYLKQIHLDNAQQYLETAIAKQQQAHDMLLQLNPELKNVTPENVATANVTPVNNPETNPSQPINNSTQPNSTQVAANNVPANPVHTNSDTTHTNRQTNPVAVNHPTQVNNTQATTDTVHNNNRLSTSVALNNPTSDHTQNGSHSIPTNPADTVDANQKANPININPRVHHDEQVTSQPENNATASSNIVLDEIKQLPKSPYSKANPIPINPPLPEGLVFKVQIGAFKNPISQTAFKGLEPIAGEVTGNGLTRYTAGLFKEFNKAKGAQTKVRGIGYKDAFIVAFYNGKRISIQEAASIQSGNQPGTNTTAVTNTHPNPSTHTTPQAQTNTTQGATVNQTETNNPANPVVSTPVTEVKGIFYTVQVGAFKTTVSSSKLYNLSPLFSYNASNGYIRYNCGIYSSVPNASSAKDAIVSKTPIKDAFVVAYYNGERIGIPQAAQMLANGTAVLSKNPKLDIVPGGNAVIQPTKSSSPPPVSNTPFNSTDTGKAKVTFSVQVGAYSGQIPIEVANNLLKIATQGITTHKEADGTVSYTVGAYKDYASSKMLKEELVQDGFPGCFVVAYNNGKKISLKEAQALINK